MPKRCFTVLLPLAALALALACRTPTPAEPAPSWAPPSSALARFSREDLQRTAVVTIPGGATAIVPVEPRTGEKFMLNWKLLSGPRWVNYVVRDSAGNTEFGLGQLTAVQKGIYSLPVRYFCFGNEYTPATTARVAIAALYYERLPEEGTLLSLPISDKLDLAPPDPGELAAVAPVVWPKYTSTTIGNSYYSPVFQVQEGQTFRVTLRSDSPIEVRAPGRPLEYRQGIMIELTQATRWHNERAEWAYAGGGIEVRKYDRPDAGKTVEITAIARPDAKETDVAGLYQLKATNGDPGRRHPLEYTISRQ